MHLDDLSVFAHLEQLRALQLDNIRVEYLPSTFAAVTGLAALSVRDQGSIAQLIDCIKNLKGMKELTIRCELYAYQKGDIEKLLHCFPSLVSLSVEVFWVVARYSPHSELDARSHPDSYSIACEGEVACEQNGVTVLVAYHCIESPYHVLLPADLGDDEQWNEYER